MKLSHRRGSTLDDIGRELGLSAMTVSRALNGHPNVHEDTRNKVLRIAQRLNYRPNRWARSLATRRSRIIGVVVPDISHGYFSEIIRAIQDTIEPRGYDLMLCHTHADSARETAALDMLLGSRVEGLLVASSLESHDYEAYETLQYEGVPVVLLDRYFPGLDVPHVRTDDALVARLATKHLLDLGHRRIAHIRGPNVTTGCLRAEAFCNAMSDAGINVEENWLSPARFDLESGYKAMRRLLSGEARPTAVFAANDPLAFGALQACRDAGLSVPGDISLVGAGSIEGAYHPSPFLTTVDWSRQEMGIAGTNILLAMMEEGTWNSTTYVAKPHLIVRQSTAPPKLD